MGSLKPWQLVLVIVAALVLAVSLWISLTGEKVDFGDRVYMVDVETGTLYYADTGGRRGVVIPAKHPETGKRTLVPVQIEENGEVAISGRYRGTVSKILESEQITLSDQIARGSGVITETVDNAKKYVRPG